MTNETPNPYLGTTRTGKQWAKSLAQVSQLMAEAISDGDWERAEGWAAIASWQHELLEAMGSDK